jgi:putative resolvase
VKVRVNLQSESICAILSKMERIVAIGEAADVLGVSIATLRRWEAAGKLAAEHTVGGHRRDDVAK